MYLRDLYTNSAGQLFCQICRQGMPFKKRNGQHYFERKEAFNLPREHVANSLALCPVCAAKYFEFVERDPGDARTKLMQSLLASEQLEVAIDLGNDEEAAVRFVEPHFIDLKTVLEELSDKMGS